MTFNPGDRVTVSGLPATIVVYDETVNQLVFESELPGGATNTTYAHISNSDVRPIESLVPQAEELPLSVETGDVVAEDPNPNPGSEQ